MDAAIMTATTKGGKYQIHIVQTKGGFDVVHTTNGQAVGCAVLNDINAARAKLWKDVYYALAIDNRRYFAV